MDCKGSERVVWNMDTVPDVAVEAVGRDSPLRHSC